jgi:drug/metabolite transporter (DMT)-like permease
MALLVILLWGSNYSVQKALMAHIGPGALLFARYLVTPACAVLLLLWNHGLHWPRVQRRDWLALAGLAGVQVAGIALAFAGMLVFMADKLAVVRTQGLGDLLLLLGTMLFSAHTVAASKLIDRHGVMVVMAYSTLLAMTPMVLINTPQAMGVAWSSLPPALWWGLLYSLAVPSFAGWLAWGWLNTHVGVQRTAPLLYLLPPVAGIISWIALGESFSGLKIVGAIMAGAGVAITQFAARPTPATELVKREQPPDATV